MVRILHIVGSVERAGIETFLINLYRMIDRSKIQFDFAIYNAPTDGSYGTEIESLGGKIYLIPPKNKGWIKNYNAVKKIVKDNNYKIVWRDASNAVGAFDIIAAGAGGANERIVHSHSSRSFGRAKYIHYVLRPIVNMYATKRIACGEKAGRWMFGDRGFEVIPNGIDTVRFKSDSKIRQEIRDNMKIGDSIVIGHIGRFEKVKNQSFLIRVFAEFRKRNRDSKLLMIGDGELMQECRNLAKELGVFDDVIFTGKRNDIPELLQAIDVFVMPSVYEGFPVTMVEAQAAGLPCVVSDSISRETDIYGGVSFVGLDQPINEWCDMIDRKWNVRYDDGYARVAGAGYDIKDISERITEIILDKK